MKVNPAKCTFEVKDGKILVFMVERGIQANTENIRIVSDIPRPRKVRDFKKTIGMIVALNRSISKVADKSIRLFKALKMSKNVLWTEEADDPYGS